MDTPVGSANYGHNAFGGSNTIGGSGFMGFAPSFAIYPIEGTKLAAAQALSYQFENVWVGLQNIAGGNPILLTTLKTILDRSYMDCVRAITKPIVNTTGTGVMAF